VGYVRGVRRALIAVLVAALAATGLGIVFVTTPLGATAASCPALPAPDAGTTRVMVAGDSLTQGSSGDWTWRYRVWKHLQPSGADVDFVGPFDFMYDNQTFAFGNHDYADPCFDAQHYALGGATYASMLAPPAVSPQSSSGIAWAVSSYHPDVVVQLAGVNDLKQGASIDEVLARAKAVLDQIRSANPDATVVIPSLPTVQLPDLVPEYNTRLAALVPTWSTAQSRVVFTDTMRAWAGASDTWDGWHPNAMGELHVAAAIEDAFHEIGLGAASDQPIPTVPLGPRVPATLSVEPGDGAVTLNWVSPPGATQEYIWYRDVTADAAWTPIAGGIGGSGAAVSNLENGRQYAFRVQAAKGTAVAQDIVSNVVDAVPGMPAPTPTPTPTPSADPTPGPSASPLPTPTPTATPTPTPSPSASPLPTPTPPPVTLGRVSPLTGTPDYHAVELSWGPVAEATSYRVSWRETDSAAYRDVETTGSALTVTGLVAGQSYAFEVQAIRGASVGLAGPEVVVTALGTVTTAPPRPRLVRLAGHRIGVHWLAPFDATRYCVQLRRPGHGWTTVAWTESTRLATRRLHARTTYAVRVQPWHELVPGHTSPAAQITLR
jgi:hypothetical protein